MGQTVTLHAGQLLILLAVSTFIGMLGMHVIADILTRRQKVHEDRDKQHQQEHKEHELRKKRDHQLNHGGRVYNWLKKKLESFEEHGLHIEPMPENAGAYSIIITCDSSAMQGFDHILQLDFDFVNYQEPYLGHIHYGVYGADILIWVGDHGPTAGLDGLVVSEVRQYMERRLAISAEA